MGATVQTQQLVIEFLQAKKAEQRADKTIKGYKTVLFRLSQQFPTMPISQRDIRVFLAESQGEPETIDSYYRQLRHFFNWLKIERRYKHPMTNIKPPHLRPKVPPSHSPERLRMLLTHHSHSDMERALMYFLADTAARVGEAANLNHSDIDATLVKLAGKNGQHYVPISPEVKGMLQRLPKDLHEPDAVFWGVQGRYRADTLSKKVATAIKRTGICGPRLAAHSLRHTFGVLWAGDETLLQTILGHSNLKTTQRYRPYRVQAAQAQHQTYSPIRQMRNIREKKRKP